MRAEFFFADKFEEETKWTEEKESILPLRKSEGRGGCTGDRP